MTLLEQIGAGMQVVAMALPPLSIVLNLVASESYYFGVSNMLVMLVFSVSLFYAGRIVRGYGAPDDGQPGGDRDDDLL